MSFEAPMISLTLSRRVNLGNYESADVSVTLSRIPFEADERMIQDMLDTSNIAFSVMRQDLRNKIAKIRMEHLNPDASPVGAGRD